MNDSDLMSTQEDLDDQPSPAKRPKLDPSLSPPILKSDGSPVSQATVRLLRMKNEVLRTRLSQCEATAREFYKIRKELGEIYEREKSSLQMQLQLDEDEIEHLQGDLTTALRDNSEMREAVVKLEDRISELLEENTRLRTDSEAAEALKGNLQAAEERIVELEHNLEEFRVSRAELRRQKVELNEAKLMVQKLEQLIDEKSREFSSSVWMEGSAESSELIPVETIRAEAGKVPPASESTVAILDEPVLENTPPKLLELAKDPSVDHRTSESQQDTEEQPGVQIEEPCPILQMEESFASPPKEVAADQTDGASDELMPPTADLDDAERTMGVEEFEGLASSRDQTLDSVFSSEEVAQQDEGTPLRYQIDRNRTGTFEKDRSTSPDDSSSQDLIPSPQEVETSPRKPVFTEKSLKDLEKARQMVMLLKKCDELASYSQSEEQVDQMPLNSPLSDCQSEIDIELLSPGADHPEERASGVTIPTQVQRSPGAPDEPLEGVKKAETLQQIYDIALSLPQPSGEPMEGESSKEIDQAGPRRPSLVVFTDDSSGPSEEASKWKVRDSSERNQVQGLRRHKRRVSFNIEAGEQATRPRKHKKKRIRSINVDNSQSGTPRKSKKKSRSDIQVRRTSVTSAETQVAKAVEEDPAGDLMPIEPEYVLQQDADVPILPVLNPPDNGMSFDEEETTRLSDHSDSVLIGEGKVPVESLKLHYGKHFILVSSPKFFGLEWSTECTMVSQYCWECKSCTEKKHRKYIMEDHVWVVHYGGAFKCMHCPFADEMNWFESRTFMLKHCRTMHPELVKKK